MVSKRGKLEFIQEKKKLFHYIFFAIYKEVKKANRKRIKCEFERGVSKIRWLGNSNKGNALSQERVENNSLAVKL